MIDVWLKIKDRGNLNQVLKNLNFWISIFGDNEKYNLIIYNEDVALPRFYCCYNIFNRNLLMNDNQCKAIQKLINDSSISLCWRNAAFALCSPYFYNTKNNFLLNIDADDMIMFGDVEKYINQIKNIMISENISTMSYDYIFSRNIFDQKNMMPNHWTFGANISDRQKMSSIILNVLENSVFISNKIKNINKAYEVNIDMLISQFLLENNKEKYNCFITKEGMIHSNNNFYYYINYNNSVNINFNGTNFHQNKHEKTLELK